MHSSIQLPNPIEFININSINPLISKCQIKVCYVGEQPNRNGSIITREVAEQIAQSLPGSPIVGYYNENAKDFEEHNRAIRISESKDSFELVETTIPYGFVDVGAKVWFQKFLDDNEFEREYVVTEGYLWTGQYPECQRVIENGNNQSMEFDKNLSGSWTKPDNKGQSFFIVNEAIISKLCILGEDFEPCFEGANITKPTIQFSLGESFNQQLFSMMTELKELLSKGGAKVYNRYTVEVGDALYEALDNHVEASYANYGIESVCEDNGQVFAVLSADNQYYRLDLSENDGAYTFGELSEISEYTPDADPQFAAEAIEAYKKKKEEDKESSKDEKKSSDDDEADSKESEGSAEEKSEKSEEDEDEDEKKKKKKFSLEEIPEYVELQNQFSLLQNQINEITAERDSLVKEVSSLKEFKAKIDRQEKQAMIEKFYMLTEEDKADVINNIDTYSIDDIEAKLSVICVRNKISFNLEDDADKKGSTTFNLDGGNDDSTPAWVKAVMEVAKSMN